MNKIIEADFLPPAVEEAKEKPRILIIDNNRDFTYSAKVGLARTGRYSVWEENEPARAHQTAQRVKPDLILLDIAMPETDGGDDSLERFGRYHAQPFKLYRCDRFPCSKWFILRSAITTSAAFLPA